MLGNCSNWLVSCERSTGGKNWGNTMVGDTMMGNTMVGNRGCHRLVSSEGEGGVANRMVAN